MALRICSSCQRHVKESDETCPFCGGALVDAPNPAAPERAMITLYGMPPVRADRDPLQPPSRRGFYAVVGVLLAMAGGALAYLLFK